MVGTNLGGCHRYLGDNDLAGTMPTELGLLTSLIDLYAFCYPPPCVSR
jgi:hypothetical protein